MSYSNLQIQDIIGAGNEKEQEDQTFGTPAALEAHLAEAVGIRDWSPKGGRGGKGNRGRGARGGRQRNLVESFNRTESPGGKRKKRIPEELRNIAKKEETKGEEVDNPFQKSDKVKRSPIVAEEAEAKEEGEMNEVLKRLEEMQMMMKEEKEKRKGMMEEWDKKWEGRCKHIEGLIKEEKEERKRGRIE